MGNKQSGHENYIPPPRPSPAYASPTYSFVPPVTYSQQQPAAQSENAPAPANRLARKFSRKYTQIGDKYKNLDQVQAELASAGLESSNLIVGIDLTKSNEWTGKHSYNGRSLHFLMPPPMLNPYEQALSIIGRTLSPFDEDNLIPCFGFGDSSTHDQHVFSFFQDHRPCNGFQEALQRYRTIVPHVRLAGPTSFAPLIEAAIDIVEESGGQYHVLLIIADGQVTRSVDTDSGHLSPQEESTIQAIVAASDYPLSIVLVGVGDGPWDTMREFDDHIPDRSFDNFQFVNFTEIMAKNVSSSEKEAMFALSALMEIPSQYKASIELGMLGRRKGIKTKAPPKPPPPRVLQADTATGIYPHSVESTGAYDFSKSGKYFAPSASAPGDNEACSICLSSPKNMAFQCGHQTCRDCGKKMTMCPICRERIVTRINLYG